MIKNDEWIIKMAEEHNMLNPFESGQVRKGVVSYGVSSYGYDVRIWNEFKVLSSRTQGIIDPKSLDTDNFETVTGDFCVIPPNSYILGRTVEYFKMPRKIMGICTGKSTYARCGIITNITPLEPEWEGYITIAIVNASPLPAKIYANEGIAQVIFIESDSISKISYKDKGGKYQGQKELTLPKIDKE
ncbi:dCTP deaminase [candidate division KSB1 bacterium]